MIKTYQSKRRLEHHTIVTVNGKRQEVSFTGGRNAPRRENGKFVTRDPEIQKALERHPHFGTHFVLISETNEPTEEQGEPEDVMIVDEVENAQQAKDWLVSNFKDVTYNMVQNSTKVKEVASQKGVKFPSWQ